jgi:uncharacterized membrane protein
MDEALFPDAQLVKPLPLNFLLGLILVNFIAIFQFDLLYIGSLISFLYILVVPGLLLLPFFIKKRLPFAFGIALSVAISIFVLMVVGLGLNTLLPFFGITQPLATLPLMLAFDALIYILLTFNFGLKKIIPLEIPRFNTTSWILVGLSIVMPILACIGAISVTNGGTNLITMATYGMVVFILLGVIFNKDRIDAAVPPTTLFFMALAFLLTNSMRGWFVTGHDILLEYHVFILTDAAKHLEHGSLSRSLHGMSESYYFPYFFA